MPSFARRHLLLLALYSLLALLLTWPLVAHFTTHVPGDGIDDPALAWNLWWIKHQLVEQLQADIFHSDWMFHPITINLAFYTLTPLNGLLSIPLQSGLSLVVASNLLVLSSFVLGGYGAFLLALSELRHSYAKGLPQTLWSSACLAGIIYAFASSKLFYASLGQFNIASSQWIPFCLLYVLRIGRSTTGRSALRNGLLAGLFWSFQAWAELTYATFLLIFIGVWFVWQIASRRNLKLSLIGTLALGVVAALGLAPFLWAMLPDLRSEGDFFTSGGGFADIYSADLLGYLIPTRLHPLVGDWVETLTFPNDKAQHIYIGYSALLLAGFATYSALRTRLSFWVCNALLFWTLTLGPYLRWNGRDLPIPGPFALVSQLPFFSGNRYPSRYSVMVMICIAVLAAHGMVKVMESGKWRMENGGLARAPFSILHSPFSILTAIITLLFLFEHLSVPLPINNFEVPAIYQTIAQTPGDFTLLELPTGWRNGARVLGKSDVLIMMQEWYQTTHGKRRLGGNTSRNPPYKFQYFSEAPLIGELIALMNANDGRIGAVIDADYDRLVAESRQNAVTVLDFLDVRFITLHIEKSPPQLIRFVEEALPVDLIDEWQGLDQTGTASTIRLYQVKPAALAPQWTIDMTTEFAKLYLGEGWGGVAKATDGDLRVIQRDQATLLLDIPTQGGELQLRLYEPGGQAKFWLNGHRLISACCSANLLPGTIQVAIAPGLANAAIDRLEVQVTTPPITSENFFSLLPAEQWQIGTTGTALAPTTTLYAESAGQEVGNFAHLYLNGVDVAGDERGYHLVAVDSAGNLLASAVFDTFGNCGIEPPDESAAQAMAVWLQQWPTGTIIAGAVADEASCRLNQTVIDALQRVGVAGDLRGKFRWSQAFVGVVGATPGSATESMSLLRPARVSVGAPLSGEGIYAGVSEVRFIANVRN